MGKNQAQTRLFALGIGYGASTELVEGVATAGRGTADFVTEGEALDRKVVALLKRASSSALYNVKITPHMPTGGKTAYL